MLVSLVLNSHLGQMTQDVLHLSVGPAAGFAAEVVEPLDAVEEVVAIEVGHISQCLHVQWKYCVGERTGMGKWGKESWGIHTQ